MNNPEKLATQDTQDEVVHQFSPTNINNTRYDYNLTIMKSPKPATDTIYPHIKF